MSIMIGENLKELRKRKGSKQEDLAKFLNISINAVSKWERGECYPDIELLPKIAEYYNTDINEMLVGNITNKNSTLISRELEHYKKMRNDPTWVLLYKLKWAQLANITDLKNLKILDFGSGFGTTANYLAKDNEVIAIEPRSDMIEARARENNYTQIQGKIEKLNDFADDSFDVVICHNVLEFASDENERVEIVKEFSRILKTGGILSIIKNNEAGRIMSMVVSLNKIDEAMGLLEGGNNANIFGKVVLYDPEDLIKWGNNLKIEKILSTRTFYGLQNQGANLESDWISKMFNIEMKVADMEPYKSIALFHHVLLRKV